MTQAEVEGSLLGRAARVASVFAKYGLRETRGGADPIEIRARRLRDALEELGPTFAKLGQQLNLTYGTGDEAKDVARDVERQRVDHRKPVLPLEVGEQLLLADEREPNEVGRECAAVLALLLERLHQLVGGQVAALLEDVSET